MKKVSLPKLIVAIILSGTFAWYIGDYLPFIPALILVIVVGSSLGTLSQK